MSWRAFGVSEARRSLRGIARAFTRCNPSRQWPVVRPPNTLEMSRSILLRVFLLVT